MSPSYCGLFLQSHHPLPIQAQRAPHWPHLAHLTQKRSVEMDTASCSHQSRLLLLLVAAILLCSLRWFGFAYWECWIWKLSFAPPHFNYNIIPNISWPCSYQSQQENWKPQRRCDLLPGSLSSSLKVPILPQKGIVLPWMTLICFCMQSISLRNCSKHATSPSLFLLHTLVKIGL